MVGDLRIVLTGGGSGGHIYPLIAIVQAFKKIGIEQGTEFDIRYFGPIDPYSQFLVQEGIETWKISASKIRRYASAANFLDVPKFFWSVLQALVKLLVVMPDVIFSKGGPGALPVVIAGWFYRIPIIVHDSDAVPGLTTKTSSMFAAKVIVSFERAQKFFSARKTLLIGNPVRLELLRDKPNKEVAKKALGFDSTQPLLLIIGGSQGSQRINEFIELQLEELLKLTQVLHQTGVEKYKESQALGAAALSDVSAQERARFHYKPVPYFDTADLKNALAAADIVVTRAGSGAIFEIAAFEKPAILIPLEESANDHQKENAFEFGKSGGAVVIEEANLLPGIFLHEVRTILKDGEVQKKMCAAAAAFFKPRIAELIAEEIIKTALAE